VRIYNPDDGERQWVCGHWNGSPIEIGVTPVLHDVPDTEVVHHHPYAEYYIVTHGSGALEVNGERVPLVAGSVVMVESGERHRVVDVGPEGVRWIVVKERSVPGSKLV